MNPQEQFRTLMQGAAPVLALAPMQDVTDLPFMRLMATFGGPDVYFTEYFRVYETSVLDKHILRSITENPTGRPVIAQMIGNHIPSLTRIARALERHPVAGVDLNLGCPAPVVYRKCAGGGLLREPGKVDAILGALRETVTGHFTVKTRIGFETAEVFAELLPIFARHRIDLLSVHGRTVKEMYKSAVHYDFIKRAVDHLPCPVLANGNIYSAAKGEQVLAETGARGLMVGRGAIRNPWIFHQLRQQFAGEPLFQPQGHDVLRYIHELHAATAHEKMSPEKHVQKMKKYLNFLGLAVDAEGRFLHEIRRAREESEFFRICADFLEHDRLMTLEPLEVELGPRDNLAGVHT